MMNSYFASLRHLFAGVLLILAGTAPVAAQNDLSVIAITRPVSGCALTANQAVTLRVFNYGNTLPASTSFNVSYTINAGTPTTEMITLASPLVSNSTLTYNLFNTSANLSVPGTYTFDASVALGGDVNPTNNALTGSIVVNTAPSVAGTLTGPTSGSSGTLTLSGQTGAVVQWEESLDNLRWFKLANTTTTQAYAGLIAPTRYRVRVANGACAPVVSNVVLVNP